MSWEADYQRDFAAQAKSGPTVLSEEQRSKNLQLRDLVQDILPLDDDQKLSDCDLLYRFLIGRHWEVKSAEQMVRKYKELRKTHHLNGIMAEEMAAEVKAVMSSVFGVDKEGLPILWMLPDPAKLLPVLKSRSKEELLRAQMHVMEEARYISRQRGVDRCTYVLDMDRITMSSVNTMTLSFLRELMRVLQEYYPEIMRRLLIFNTGWAITGAWKVLKPFVDVRVQDKIRFSNGPPSVKALAEFMTPDNILPEYGGTSSTSVLDELLRAEVTRLRALKAEQQKTLPVATSPPAAAALPSTTAAAAPTTPPEALSTLKHESPRSLEVPEDLPVDHADEDNRKLYSLGSSFVGDDPGAAEGEGDSADDFTDRRSFKSARSCDDLTTLPGSADSEKGKKVVVVGDRSILAQFSSFFGVADGYLDGGGASAGDTDSESGIPEPLVDDGDKEKPKLEGEAAGRGAAASAASTTTACHVDPTAASAAPVHAVPSSVFGSSTRSGAEVASPLSPSSSLLSGPGTPFSGTATTSSVALNLVQSADGTIIGYHGSQFVGKFRGSIVYGNPLFSQKLLEASKPREEQPLTDDGGGAQEAGVHGAGAPAESSTSSTPVAYRAHDFSAAGNEGDSEAPYIVGELLRESGHPIHNYVIVCDAKRMARFVIRKSRFRSRVSVYQVVGDATVTTDGRVRHSIAGQKVKMGVTEAPASPAARRDPGAWLLFGEDVTRQRKSFASSLWRFGKGGGLTTGNLEGAEAAANAGTDNALLAKCFGQTVEFFGVLTHSHPVELFTLAMAIGQLWVEGEMGPSGGGSGSVRGLGASLRHSESSRSLSAGAEKDDKEERASEGSSSRGRPGHSSGGSGGLAVVGGLLREVGSKLTKSSEPRSHGSSKIFRQA